MNTNVSLEPITVEQASPVVQAGHAAVEIHSYALDGKLGAVDRIGLIDRGKEINRAIRFIEEDRKKITRPLDEAKRQIMERYAEILRPLQIAATHAANVELACRRYDAAEAERVRKEREAEAREAAKAAADQGGPAPPAMEPFVPPPSNVARGVTAKTIGRKVLNVELNDVAALAASPWAHLLDLNDARAKIAFRALRDANPEGNIPGLRFFYEESVSFGGR